MDTSHYTEYRPLMFSIAYRMTGSVSDAEDIVQEAFLRASKDADVESPKAYLATITTRLAIDHLRSARVRRESYVGTWLPEPLIGNGSTSLIRPNSPRPRTPCRWHSWCCWRAWPRPNARCSCSARSSATTTRRSPTQQARPKPPAGRSSPGPAATSTKGRPRFETSRAEGEELTSLFLAAASGGDMTSLLERLAPDVVFYGDSGGRGETTFIAPVFGRDQVAEVVRIQVERTLQLGASLRPTWVNGQPGVLACDADGGLIAVIAFDVLDGQVQAIRTVANPEKLRHIGPISRTWHLRWRDEED